MAIGDANNDVPMLKVAGFSAVMGSAKDDVKACGDVVVGDCEHDGVAEAIYKYVLKRYLSDYYIRMDNVPSL